MATTTFVSISEMRRLVRQIGLENCIRGVLEKLEEDYRRWDEFEKSARTANHSPLGVIELMPISNQEEFSFKYVNGHPQNYKDGMSTVMAFGVLSEVKTGWPKLLTEMTILTAIRTAAMSVFAARMLARKESKSMAMIGCGAQSEFQILAFHYILGITDFVVYDTDPEASSKLKGNLPQLNIGIASSTREAVRGKDIVTTCTADKTRATILVADMILPGMHINAIGGDCPGKTELDAEVLRLGPVFVEYEPQTRIEGDLQQMPISFPVTELWKVHNLVALGRTKPEEITIFDSVGFAIEDFSALRWLFSVVDNDAFGESIDLVPNMTNVKDLFGFAGLVTSTV